MRSTDDQSTIRWLLVVGLYCFRGLKIDFSQNLSLCDRCTKSVRVHLPCVSRYEIQRFHLRSPTSWLTEVLGTCVVYHGQGPGQKFKKMMGIGVIRDVQCMGDDVIATYNLSKFEVSVGQRVKENVFGPLLFFSS